MITLRDIVLAIARLEELSAVQDIIQNDTLRPLVAETTQLAIIILDELNDSIQDAPLALKFVLEEDEKE